MSTAPTTTGNKAAKIIGVVTAIAGLVLIIAGGITWGTVAGRLDAENIVVADDADNFAGQAVNNPWTAFAEADIIAKHALDATGGKTYAELDREDPLRSTAMNGSFLRASLFTSVVAFGIAALVMGLGVLFILVGYGLVLLSGRSAATDPALAEPAV